MLIITDGGENASKRYNLNDLKEAIRELSKRGICCIVPKLNNWKSIDFAEAISVEPFSFSIDDYDQYRCTLLRFPDVLPEEILLKPSAGYLK